MNLKASAISTSSVKVTWNQLNSADWNGKYIGYQINYHSSVDKVNKSITSIGTSEKILNLHYGTVYQIYVWFISTGGVGPTAPSIFVETLQDGKWASMRS